MDVGYSAFWATTPAASFLFGGKFASLEAEHAQVYDLLGNDLIPPCILLEATARQFV